MAAVVIAPLPGSARPSASRPGLVPASPVGVRHAHQGPDRRAPRLDRRVYLRRRCVVALVGVVASVLVVQLASFSVGLVSARSSTPSAAARAPSLVGLSPSAPPRPGVADVYVVEAGDTLWSIARRLDPEGDPRPLVDRLAERTGGVPLRAGQRLRLDGLR
jgi:hypothetical protein